MKYFYVIIFVVLFIGCSDDEPTNPTPIPSASRNIVDYMYSGKEGTEYWVREKITVTDTNNNTYITRDDTIAARIINRNFNHPLLGSCIQVVELLPNMGYRIRDTLYYFIQNNAIHITNSSVYEPDIEIIELLRAPLQKGTKTMTAGEEAEITDMDVPITNLAGTFTAVVVKAYQKQTSTGFLEVESENEYYFVEKALFAKIVQKSTTLFLHNNKKYKGLREYELFAVKNAQ